MTKLCYLTLCVFAPEKARLDELKEKLSSTSLKGSARKMQPIEFEKVRQVCSETPAAHTAEATDSLAAECCGEPDLDLWALSVCVSFFLPHLLSDQNRSYSTSFMKQNCLCSAFT